MFPIRQLAPFAAVATGGLALVGWVCDIEWLKRGLSQSTTVNPVTALLLALNGVGLLALGSRRLRPAALPCAIIGGLTALVILASLLIGATTGPDTVLFGGVPARMAPLTALDLGAIAVGLGLLAGLGPRAAVAAQVAALAVLGSSLLVLVGYLHNALRLVGVPSFVPMATYTATGLFFLSLGLLLAAPGRGLMAALTGDGPAAQLGQVLMPAALLVPVGLDWARELAQTEGLFDAEIGRALAVLCSAAAFMTFVWWTGEALTEADRARAADKAALATAARQYMLLADNATDVIVRVDLNGVRRYASPSVKELMGFEPWEVIGRRAIDDIHPDDRAEVQRLHAEIAAGRDRARIIGRILHKAGHYIWVEVAMRLVRDPATGAPIEMQGSVREIGDRKRAEAALIKQRSFFRALFDHTTDGLFAYRVLAGGAVRLEEINPAAAAVLGIPRESVAGKAVRDIFPPSLAPIIVENLRRCALSGEVMKVQDPVLGGGSRVWEVIHVPIRGENGAVDRILASTRDVTEARMAELAIQEKNRQLQLAEQMAGIGHWRLALPSRAITWSNEVYRIHGLDPAAGPPDLNAAIDAYHPEDRAIVASHVERSIAEGLEYKMRLRLVRPDGTIRQVQAHGVPEYGPDGALVAVFGVFMDVTEQHRAQAAAARLQSLSPRARGAGEASGAELERAARDAAATRALDDQAKSRFLANISHELRTPLNDILGYAQLLQRDGRLDTTQSHQVGAMLEAGRTLLQTVNGALDGSISEAALSAAAAAASDPAPPAARPRSRRKLTVLVADDVALNRDIAASMLRNAGHTVVCVDSGVAAVGAVAAGGLDVVLMDVKMPGMDGLEATRRIRALGDAASRVPIVAVTAHAFADQVDRCREAGMDSHVTKPFDLALLLHAVESASALEAAAA